MILKSPALIPVAYTVNFKDRDKIPTKKASFAGFLVGRSICGVGQIVFLNFGLFIVLFNNGLNWQKQYGFKKQAPLIVFTNSLVITASL